MIVRSCQNPARAARRKTELRERLSVERPSCAYCGYPELVALRRLPGKLLPDHHVLGQNHDPDLSVIACLNCHAVMHELLADAGIELQPITDPVMRVATMLRAEALHFEMLASSKRRQAALLEGRR
jgi:hypothetical protein